MLVARFLKLNHVCFDFQSTKMIQIAALFPKQKSKNDCAYKDSNVTVWNITYTSLTELIQGAHCLKWNLIKFLWGVYHTVKSSALKNKVKLFFDGGVYTNNRHFFSFYDNSAQNTKQFLCHLITKRVSCLSP